MAAGSAAGRPEERKGRPQPDPACLCLVGAPLLTWTRRWVKSGRTADTVKRWHEWLWLCLALWLPERSWLRWVHPASIALAGKEGGASAAWLGWGWGGGSACSGPLPPHPCAVPFLCPAPPGLLARVSPSHHSPAPEQREEAFGYPGWFLPLPRVLLHPRSWEPHQARGQEDPIGCSLLIEHLPIRK